VATRKGSILKVRDWLLKKRILDRLLKKAIFIREQKNMSTDDVPKIIQQGFKIRLRLLMVAEKDLDKEIERLKEIK
jgi:hypothetical protein